MNRLRKLFFGYFLISLLFFFKSKPVLGQENCLFVDQIEDSTFYDSFCFDQKWSWLCRGEPFLLSALKEKDGWFYFSQGFFNDQNSQKSLVFNFEPWTEEFLPDNPVLVVNLKSVTSSIGTAKLWFDWGEGWQSLDNHQTENWLIFWGDSNQHQKINLFDIFPESVSAINNFWRIKLEVVPLIPVQPVMLALDQVIIENQSPFLEPSPNPTPTPVSPSPTPEKPLEDNLPKGEFVLPKPKGKVYFNEAVDLAISSQDGFLIEKIILQYSVDDKSWQDIFTKEINQKKHYWQYRWYPLEEGDFRLRAKIYNKEGSFVLINHLDRFIFDQTAPEIIWQAPLDGDLLNDPLEVKITSQDSLAGIDSEVRFFYRYQNGVWQEIISFPWYFPKNLSLGNYQLRAQVSDRAGNQSQEEIGVRLSLKIFDIFLVDGILSWQTSHPTISRVVYDYQSWLSRGGVNENFPNFGYTWASDQLSQEKKLTHQYSLPQLPPGEYFARILALEDPVVYSLEFSFKTDSFLLGQGEAAQVLGTMANNDSEFPKEQTPFPSPEENVSSNDFGFKWARVLVILLLAL
ncbi:MAG: hypothetical protein PHX72_02940, partial [Candidatus Shapirobacteria bacterium]|nr:hypothetical protein [Candidatus Shapirobacteria bacterium]